MEILTLLLFIIGLALSMGFTLFSQNQYKDQKRMNGGNYEHPRNH